MKQFALSIVESNQYEILSFRFSTQHNHDKFRVQLFRDMFSSLWTYFYKWVLIACISSKKENMRLPLLLTDVFLIRDSSTFGIAGDISLIRASQTLSYSVGARGIWQCSTRCSRRNDWYFLREHSQRRDSSFLHQRPQPASHFQMVWEQWWYHVCQRWYEYYSWMRLGPG
jgi:hypothetical protein